MGHTLRLRSHMRRPGPSYQWRTLHQETLQIDGHPDGGLASMDDVAANGTALGTDLAERAERRFSHVPSRYRNAGRAWRSERVEYRYSHAATVSVCRRVVA